MARELPGGGRYYPISAYYRSRFGSKVYKVGVSVAQSCPNREGLRGMRPCVFCDEWGSAAYPETAGLALAEQVRRNGAILRSRYRAERLLVYFQAYTTTFSRVSQLERWLNEALAQPDVAGVVLGTRPDCLTPTVIRVLRTLARQTYVAVELGVQTLDDAQLKFLERGHDAACARQALERLAQAPELDGGVHLMFGLPGESDAQLRRTAWELSALGLSSVKLHNLHVLRGTPLEALHRAGGFTPVTLEEYARRVVLFLEQLSPRVAVHRLSAVASRWEDVVAPDWVRGRLAPAQYILDRLEALDTWQGRFWDPAGSEGQREGLFRDGRGDAPGPETGTSPSVSP